jgi:hypothetical protein
MTNESKGLAGSMGGINGNELANHLGELASGGNTVAGAGDPSGGPVGGTPGSSMATGDGAIAAEAAALGSVEGTLADAAAQAQPGGDRLGTVPTGGETLGGGAGRDEPGSGTPGDTGDLGGGGAEGTVQGTASPGGDGRA